MMSANALTGMREDESTPDKLMGAYRRHKRNDIGRRLLEFAAKYLLVIRDTVFCTSKRGVSHRLKSPNHGMAKYRTDYTLIRLADLRLVRNVSLESAVHKDSDHNLVRVNPRRLVASLLNWPRIIDRETKATAVRLAFTYKS